MEAAIIVEADAADREIMEMFADGKMRCPRYKRFVLVQRPDGGLEFVQEELDAMLDKVLAEAGGRPKPRPRIIAIDPPAPRARRRSVPD